MVSNTSRLGFAPPVPSVTRLLIVSIPSTCGVEVLPKVSPAVEEKFDLSTSALVEVD